MSATSRSLAGGTTARAAVVVTCFNDGETLGETICSITTGNPNAELIVVDDGSTDETTLQVLAQIARGGTRVLSQRNAGLAAAAMTGVRATSAPYVMRFDADDILEPGAVDALADALDRASPSVGAAWGDIQTFGLTTFRIPGVRSLDPWLVGYANCITGSGTLMRRSALAIAGGWQLGEGFEDWDLWMALADHGFTGVHVPLTVFRYRRDRSGLLAGLRTDTGCHYEALRRRHRNLYSNRETHRRESRIPIAARILIQLIDRWPGLSRLTRINASEAVARLFWSRDSRAAWAMLREGLALRARRGWTAGAPRSVLRDRRRRSSAT